MIADRRRVIDPAGCSSGRLLDRVISAIKSAICQSPTPRNGLCALRLCSGSGADSPLRLLVGAQPTGRQTRRSPCRAVLGLAPRYFPDFALLYAAIYVCMVRATCSMPWVEDYIRTARSERGRVRIFKHGPRAQPADRDDVRSQCRAARRRSRDHETLFNLDGLRFHGRRLRVPPGPAGELGVSVATFAVVFMNSWSTSPTPSSTRTERRPPAHKRATRRRIPAPGSCMPLGSPSRCGAVRRSASARVRLQDVTNLAILGLLKRLHDHRRDPLACRAPAARPSADATCAARTSR